MRLLTLNLLFLFFCNISISQTIKFQKNNKVIVDSRVKQNQKPADVLESEQLDVVTDSHTLNSIKKEGSLEKGSIISDSKAGKIKIVTPTTIIPLSVQTEDKNQNRNKEYTAKKQSYRPKYHQQRRVIPTLQSKKRDE